MRHFVISRIYISECTKFREGINLKISEFCVGTRPRASGPRQPNQVGRPISEPRGGGHLPNPSRPLLPPFGWPPPPSPSCWPPPPCPLHGTSIPISISQDRALHCCHLLEVSPQLAGHKEEEGEGRREKKGEEEEESCGDLREGISAGSWESSRVTIDFSLIRSI